MVLSGLQILKRWWSHCHFCPMACMLLILTLKPTSAYSYQHNTSKDKLTCAKSILANNKENIPKGDIYQSEPVHFLRWHILNGQYLQLTCVNIVAITQWFLKLKPQKYFLLTFGSVSGLMTWSVPKNLSTPYCLFDIGKNMGLAQISFRK